MQEKEYKFPNSVISLLIISKCIFFKYVSFLNITVYKFADSRAPCPRICGLTSDETFLKDVGNSCKTLMNILGNISFSALAIVRASQ